MYATRTALTSREKKCEGKRGRPPNATQEQTGGLCRGSGLKPLALLEALCQGPSEDFVPPAAQRKVVRRTGIKVCPTVAVVPSEPLAIRDAQESS